MICIIVDLGFELRSYVLIINLIKVIRSITGENISKKVFSMFKCCIEDSHFYLSSSAIKKLGEYTGCGIQAKSLDTCHHSNAWF